MGGPSGPSAWVPDAIRTHSRPESAPWAPILAFDYPAPIIRHRQWTRNAPRFTPIRCVKRLGAAQAWPWRGWQWVARARRAAGCAGHARIRRETRRLKFLRMDARECGHLVRMLLHVVTPPAIAPCVSPPAVMGAPIPAKSTLRRFFCPYRPIDPWGYIASGFSIELASTVPQIGFLVADMPEWGHNQTFISQPIAKLTTCAYCQGW